ncbi:type II toxin-antitoxin system RelE/ParE family toxin [candidate division KSB1 bacterium]|nr:type II toxin-antitoxin system RelE/ParE family toxin [candidate division KSB1 bacterium]
MKEILFYRTSNGRCPVEEFLDELSEKQTRKVTWVLRIIREIDKVPSEYFKRLVNTDDIWEVRVHQDKLSIRILGFFHKNKFIVLTNGFIKKSQKTPILEIKLAEERKKDYMNRSE